MTVKDLKAAQTALWLNWPILSLLSLSTSFSGLSIYYLYQKCDPLLQGRITSRDQVKKSSCFRHIQFFSFLFLSSQLMPIFVVDVMGDLHGLPGLFVAGIFSASLSSVSAAVNSLSAVTLEDYVKPLYMYIKKYPLSDRKSTFLSKLFALLYGLLCIGVAFIAQLLGGVLQASLTIFGVVGGPLLGLFTLGMFVPQANQRVIFCL